MRVRLDVEMVRRGLARSRENAAQLISDGLVTVRGLPATKPATQVDAETSINVEHQKNDYVSRGGYKLAGALDYFAEVKIADRVALDAGASTGGFTDVLLRRGAKKVFAVDVGYGQLAWNLQQEPRVVQIDRTNIRTLDSTLIPEPVDIIVADLSFISLTTVLPALIGVAKEEADFILMVKPQFEVGKENLGTGGVVREPELRKAAVIQVARSAKQHDLGTVGVVASPLPGPSGNVEYFLWLKKDAPDIDEAMVDDAIRKGPQ